MSNLPDTSNQTSSLKQLFNGAFYQNINIDQSSYDIIYGFFLDRSGSKEAANSLTSSLVTLGHSNKINPLDLLKEFDKTANESDFKKVLLALFNSGRISTSKLGYNRNVVGNQWVNRTILP